MRDDNIDPDRKHWSKYPLWVWAAAILLISFLAILADKFFSDINKSY